MAASSPTKTHFLLFFLIVTTASTSSASTLAFYNKCKETIYPGLQPSAGKPILAKGGFKLNPSQALSLRLPSGWSGRVWGRQGCFFNPATNTEKCANGDYGGLLYCNGIGGTPSATLVEITFGNGVNAPDFYDVSLVDGYNLAVSMRPFRGKGNCEIEWKGK